MISELIQIGTDALGDAVYLQEGGRKPVVLLGDNAADRRGVLCALAEAASNAGGAVLLTDTKGCLSCLSPEAPCTLWDIHGRTGLPLRTTVTELGPLLLSFLLELGEEQEELLRLIFRIADENGLLLIDTKDLKALLNEMDGHREEYEETYGTLNRSLLSSILHDIVLLETNGSDQYLFEPAIDVRDFLPAGDSEIGRIHVIDARDQEDQRRLYACYVLFLLGELYENLEDSVDDMTCRLLILIDEAQLLLEELPDILRRRLGRILEGLSDKGVIVCLSISRNEDLPEEISDIMGQTFRTVQAGMPGIVTVTGPGAHLEPAPDARTVTLISSRWNLRVLSARERSELCASDPLHEKYKIPFDRDSAYEFLKRRGLVEREAKGTPAAVSGADLRKEESSPAHSTGTSSEANTVPDSSVKAGTVSDESGNASGTSSLEEMAKRARSSAKSLGNTVAGTVGRKIGKSIGSSFGDFGETLGGNIGASLGRGIINTLFKS